MTWNQSLALLQNDGIHGFQKCFGIKNKPLISLFHGLLEVSSCMELITPAPISNLVEYVITLSTLTKYLVNKKPKLMF